MVQQTDPLNWQTPIVNPNGTPTIDFMRKWQQQQASNSSIPPPGTTSVGLSAPAQFTVSGSPITAGHSGTLALAWASEAANTTFAGPASGSAAVPTFRALVGADLPLFTSSVRGAVAGSGGGTVNFLRADGSWAIPPGSGSGTVTSVAMTGDGTVFNASVTGSPITTSGTLAPSLHTQSAKLALMGPTSGSASAPTFRQPADADLSLSDITTNNVSSSAHGFAPKNPNDATKYLDGTGAYSTPSGGTGTVTTTGSPASGNLTKFSGTTSITNGDLSGDVSTSGTLTVTIKTSIALPGSPTTTTQSQNDNSTKVATTAYTDLAVANAIAGVNPAQSVSAATTAASNTSGLAYSNGLSGIGATLTGTINTAITWDGFTFSALGQRGLVKNDTQSPSGAFNGVYYVTQLQTSLLPPILTRALDYDQPSDINSTGAIPVINGTVNALTSWLLTSTITTVGTSPLTYTQFSFSPASAANPTATASDTAVNGSATTYMRSDAAPAVQLGSNTQFGLFKVDNTTITQSGGVLSSVSGGSGGYNAGTPPTIVQVAHSTSAISATFGVAPTNGNLLVAMAFNSNSNTAGTGWTKQVENSSGTDWGDILTKVAGAGESTTQSPMLNATANGGVVIWELSGQNATPFVYGLSQNEQIGIGSFNLPILVPNVKNCIGLAACSLITGFTISSFLNTGVQDVLDNTGNRHLAANHTNLALTPMAGVFALFSGSGNSKGATCLITS